VILNLLLVEGATDVLGFLDDREELQGEHTRAGAEVIGRTDIDSLRECEADHFVVAIGSNRIRAMLFDRCLDADLEPWSPIHPSATVASSAMIGQGTQIVAGVIVNPHAKIGHNVILNTGCTVDHDNVIGDHAFIAPGANLGGDVTVGEGAFVGIGASVLPGVTIGPGATVGGGAVVIEDVPADATVVGVPARVISDGAAG
jgi:sugar O-acyltransferase (sialic acid O-acetyltransferase NeuD family)